MQTCVHDGVHHVAAQSSFILDFRRDERLGVSFSRPDAPMTNRSGLIPDYVLPIPISSCSVSACIYQESTTRRSSRAVLNRKTPYYRCRCLVCMACSASYWLDRIEAKETLGNPLVPAFLFIERRQRLRWIRSIAFIGNVEWNRAC